MTWLDSIVSTLKETAPDYIPSTAPSLLIHGSGRVRAGYYTVPVTYFHNVLKLERDLWICAKLPVRQDHNHRYHAALPLARGASVMDASGKPWPSRKACGYTHEGVHVDHLQSIGDGFLNRFGKGLGIPRGLCTY